MGAALREDMAGEDDRDPEDQVPAQRDREIDAAVIVIAVALGAVILFQLVFG